MNNNPIFIIGMGRSGSTVFFEAFSQHPELMSFTNHTNRFPQHPLFALTHLFLSGRGEKPQGQSISIFNPIFSRCSEAYETWNYYFGKNFSKEFKPQKKIDPVTIEKFGYYIDKILFYSNRKRYLTKFTGPPRIEFLSTIFHEPIFIDIIRNPHAVISSLVNVEFWLREGIHKPHWIDTLSQEELKIWKNEYNASPVALAAFEWRKVYRQTKVERKLVNANYIKIRYENFIYNPQEILEKTFKHAGLALTDKIIKYVQGREYKMNNYKYKTKLSYQETKMIESICGKEMNESDYNY